MSLVVGWTEREPNERRMHHRVTTVLRGGLSAVELNNLLAEGANLTDEEACRLMVESWP
jgi:hypothetical protein